jgi:hypothetical protein
VFHVLAHVRGTASLPASAYDRVYVAWAEARLGPASARMLEEDAAVLGTALAAHEALAAVQLLAWLYDDAEHARSDADRELADVRAARPQLIEPLLAAGAGVEILRCAALLELDEVARLGEVTTDAGFGEALQTLVPVAPRLAHATVVPVRALRLRGRVFDSEIFVGAPSNELRLGAQHAAWQAAHEATVREIAAGGGLSERAVEREALELLRTRAAGAGLAASHERWLAALIAES